MKLFKNLRWYVTVEELKMFKWQGIEIMDIILTKIYFAIILSKNSVIVYNYSPKSIDFKIIITIKKKKHKFR